MIYVDTSVAIKWLLMEERSEQAIALYDMTIQTRQSIVAPHLLPLEVTNILRQRMRAHGGISFSRATEHLDAFLAFPIDYHNPTVLHHRARPRRFPWSACDIRCPLSGPGRTSESAATGWRQSALRSLDCRLLSPRRRITPEPARPGVNRRHGG